MAKPAICSQHEASEEDLVDQVSQMKMDQHSESQSCFRSQLQIAGHWLRQAIFCGPFTKLYYMLLAKNEFFHWNVHKKLSIARSISVEEKSAFLHQFGTAYPLFCHWIMTS